MNLLKKELLQGLDKKEYEIANKFIDTLNKPFADTELAIIPGLIKLTTTFKN